MTCIVGIEHDKGVYIGGDSAGISGWTVDLRSDRKVFRNGEFLFGIAGSFRMGNLLRYALVPPIPPDHPADLDRYMVCDFIPAVRAILGEGGQRKKESEVESTGDDGTFLVGVRGRLFEVGNDFQVGRTVSRYCAIGSGSTVALGALFAIAPEPMVPSERIAIALRAAEAHNIGVRAPFVIEVLEAGSWLNQEGPDR